LKSVIFKKCAAVSDEQGCFCPTYDEKTTMDLAADTVIVAAGQKMDNGLLEAEMLSSTGVHFHPITFQTRRGKVLVAGDLTRGPKSIVEAMAQGKEAAISIKRQLTGEDIYYERGNGKPYELQFEPDWNRPAWPCGRFPFLSGKDSRRWTKGIQKKKPWRRPNAA
jgi:thioredoxin reductase